MNVVTRQADGTVVASRLTPSATRAAAVVRTGVGVTVVAVVAAVFAWAFRESIGWSIEHLFGHRNSTVAAAAHSRWLIGLVVFGAVVLAAEIARLARFRHGQPVGVESIGRAARGEGYGPGVQGTFVRSAGTWVAMTGLASLGREAAILESGGAFGCAVGRRMRLSGAQLAIVGVSSGFAAAYHAPIAAVFYLREHVMVLGATRQDTAYSVAGSGIGYAMSVLVFHNTALFPRANHPLTVGVFGLVLLGLVPAALASLAFFALRRRALQPPAFVIRHRRSFAIVAALVAAVIVAWLPLTSGNGMDLIRHSAVNASLYVAGVMLVAKLVGTIASLAAGAPGGVFAPSMAIAGGGALLAFHALGAGSSGARWDAMLVLMALSVSIGTNAPLAAVFVMPEITGDWRLLPLTAMVVLIAGVIQRGVVDHRIREARGPVAQRGMRSSTPR